MDTNLDVVFQYDNLAFEKWYSKENIKNNYR